MKSVMNSLYLIFLIVSLIKVDCNPVTEVVTSEPESRKEGLLTTESTESVELSNADIESSAEEEVTTIINDSFPTDDCSDCLNRKFLTHYYAKKCKPIFDDRCKHCPKMFDCSQKEELIAGSDECLYNANIYKIGQTVPVDNPCKVCQCGYGFTHAHTLAYSTPFTTIHCITLECPEHFGVHRFPLAGFEKDFERLKNCYNVYEPNKCCAVQKKCFDLENTTNENFCEYNNKNYRIGEKIYPNEDKCKVCICDENWSPNSTVNNSGCYDVKCNLEIDRQLKDGCLPIYHENTCCPIDYYCPEKTLDADSERCSQVADSGPCVSVFKRFYYDVRDGQCHSFPWSGCGGNANNFRSLEECHQTCSKYSSNQNETIPDDKSNGQTNQDAGNYCLANGHKYEIGVKLDIDQKCVDCLCRVPPEFTCIQRSCPTPPTNECRVTYSPYDCCPIFDCSYNKTNDFPFDPLSCPTPLCEKGCLFETYPDRCPNCVCPKEQEVPDYDPSDV